MLFCGAGSGLFGRSRGELGAVARPNGNGSTPETNLPDSFSLDDVDKKTTQKNVAWVLDLPGDSNATPVVFGDKVFVTSNNADRSELMGFASASKTGKILWQKTIVKITPKEVSGTHKNTKRVTVSRDRRQQVCFTFGTGDMACFDVDGKELWTRTCEGSRRIHVHAWLQFHALLYKDKLYVEVLRRDRPECAAARRPIRIISPTSWEWIGNRGRTFSKSRGSVTRRTANASRIRRRCCTSGPGRTEILIAGSLWVSGHNPENGKEYWHWGTLTPEITGNVRSVSQPVANNDFGLRGRTAQAAGVCDQGRRHGRFVEGRAGVGIQGARLRVPSPTLYDNYLYILDDDKKRMSCLEPATSKVKWTGTLDAPNDKAGFSSSPAAGDGRFIA